MNKYLIGEFICVLREEKGLSQDDLAEMLGIHRTSVSKWERGVTTPDQKYLLKLSEIFEVSINEILMGKRLDNYKDADNITLSIMQKSKKRKRIILFLVGLLIILIVTGLLIYYFATSFNSVKIYNMALEDNNEVHIYSSSFMETRDLMQISIGDVAFSDNRKVKGVTVYCKNCIRNGQKADITFIGRSTVGGDLNLPLTIYELKGTGLTAENSPEEIMDKLYIRVYDSLVKDHFVEYKLTYNLTYANNSFFPVRGQKTYGKTPKDDYYQIKSAEMLELKDKIISFFGDNEIKKFTYNGTTYIIEWDAKGFLLYDFDGDVNQWTFKYYDESISYHGLIGSCYWIKGKCTDKEENCLKHQDTYQKFWDIINYITK